MALRTLRDLIIAVGWPIRDNKRGYTTLASTAPNQMTDEDLKGGSADKWKGSEVLFLANPPVGFANPKEVIASDPVTGTLTLDSPWSDSTGVPQNIQYVMMRLEGRGAPYDYRVAALEHAINNTSESTSRVSLGAYSQALDSYVIPAGFDSVWDVRLGTYVVPFRRWEMLPGGRLALKSAYVEDAGAVYITGSYTPEFNATLTSEYNVGQSVINDALEYLITASQRPNEQAAENRLFQERMRRDPGEYRRPNERKVLR